jgi:hypothetical protein
MRWLATRSAGPVPSLPLMATWLAKPDDGCCHVLFGWGSLTVRDAGRDIAG